jgi:hypothetical protein
MEGALCQTSYSGHFEGNYSEFQAEGKPFSDILDKIIYWFKHIETLFHNSMLPSHRKLLRNMALEQQHASMSLVFFSLTTKHTSPTTALPFLPRGCGK